MDEYEIINDTIVEKESDIELRQDQGTGSIVGFSVVGLLFLLAYSYVEVLGWMYMTMGNAVLSLSLMGGCAVLLTLTSFLLPRIRSSNSAFVSKRRVKLMVLVSVVFGIVMLFSFIGVSHYARVYNDKEEIQSLYNAGIAEARTLYPAYKEYVDQRLADYDIMLNDVVRHKNSAPEQYQQIVGRFPGEDDQARIHNLENSLLRTLQPTNDNLQENFNTWLNNAGSANLWNVSFARNVTVMKTKVTSCADRLTDLSTTFFHPGEQQHSFTFPQFVSANKVYTLLSVRGFYFSWRSLLVLLVTSFTLIMPVFRSNIVSKKDK